jgi:lipoate-protein ligase A
LALEEALIECNEFDELNPTVRLWINRPAVVLGRFQDVTLEVDLNLCTRNKIEIGRRFTGGGAIYQDDGTLNLTILTKETNMDIVELQRKNFSAIRRTLSELGVSSTVDRLNSMFVRNKKISGAAMAVRRDCILWHASILISSDLTIIHDVLAPSRKSALTRRVRSRWEPVTSLQTLLGSKIEMTDMKNRLLESIEYVFHVRVKNGTLTSKEENDLERLLASKYSRPEWNNLGVWKT